MSVETFLREVKFDDKGLVPALAVDAGTNAVLMVAYMNRDTLKESLETGKMVYWSRSRGKRWLKGEQSGNVQLIKRAAIDCDGDCLLFHVDQQGGAACHTGYPSCFYRVWNGSGLTVEGEQVFDPSKTYGKH